MGDLLVLAHRTWTKGRSRLSSPSMSATGVVTYCQDSTKGEVKLFLLGGGMIGVWHTGRGRKSIVQCEYPEPSGTSKAAKFTSKAILLVGPATMKGPLVVRRGNAGPGSPRGWAKMEEDPMN